MGPCYSLVCSFAADFPKHISHHTSRLDLIILKVFSNLNDSMIHESAWDRYDFQHKWDVVILLWVELSLIRWMWGGYAHWPQDHRVGPGTVPFTNKDATIMISCVLLLKMHGTIDVLRVTAPHAPGRVPYNAKSSLGVKPLWEYHQ